ncbi:MAG: flagellar export chaperone FliS [Acidimicrobiales bacterium]
MYATAKARNKFVSDGVGSTPSERLLVLLYDRLLRDLADAGAAIDASSVGAAHDALSHAQDIVAELHAALDPAAWSGAQEMADLYTYLADVLARANMAKSVALVEEARSVIAPLRDTWDEAYRSMTVAPLADVGAAPSGRGLDVAG